MIFSKSTLIGLNINFVLLDLSSDFLHCKQEYISLKYLGLSMGPTTCLILRENL